MPPNVIKLVSVKGNDENLVKMWNNTFQISTNVPSIQTTVMLMRTAQTPKDHSTARIHTGYSGDGVTCVGEFYFDYLVDWASGSDILVDNVVLIVKKMSIVCL